MSLPNKEKQKLFIDTESSIVFFLNQHTHSLTHPILADGNSFEDNKVIAIHVRDYNYVPKELSFLLQLHIHFLPRVLLQIKH